MTRFAKGLLLAALIPVFHPAALAQSVGANTGTATASATLQPATPGLAVPDETFVLHEGLVRELRKGGFVLYLRHGPVLPGSTDAQGPGTWWKDCQSTQRLAPEAQPRARAVGEAIVRQRIPITESFSSEFCRAIDTAAHTGLLRAAPSATLNDPVTAGAGEGQRRFEANLRDFLSNPVGGRGNRLLVGHALPTGLGAPALSPLAHLPEGSVAVFRPEGGGRFHHVATLSPGQWQWIGKQAVPDHVTVVTAAAPTAGATPAPAVAAPPPQAPMIAPERELKGVALVQALRKGGYNLYIRHAQANVGQDGNLLGTPMWWENCAIQRNLSDAGKEQARKVGGAIRELKIPVEQVLAAQFCRTRETAHLMGLGPIEVTEDINHMIGQRPGFDINASRLKRLATPPAKGTNTLLVSHTHASPRNEERIMGGIQEAEIVVYQPDGKGGTEPVARIPPPEWDNLIKAMATAKS